MTFMLNFVTVESPRVLFLQVVVEFLLFLYCCVCVIEVRLFLVATQQQYLKKPLVSCSQTLTLSGRESGQLPIYDLF